MNHPKDVRAGRVPGRLGYIFSLRMLNLTVSYKKKEFFRSERLALGTQGALLPVPHGIACLEIKGGSAGRRTRVRLCCTAPALLSHHGGPCWGSEPCPVPTARGSGLLARAHVCDQRLAAHPSAGLDQQPWCRVPTPGAGHGWGTPSSMGVSRSTST